MPKTVTYREYKQHKAARVARKKELQNGQTTLDSSRALPQRPNEVIDVDEEIPDQQDESVNPDTNGHVDPQGLSPIEQSQRNSETEPIQQRQEHHPGTNGEPDHGEPEDVEMY